jgi:hypothetical protein
MDESICVGTALSVADLSLATLATPVLFPTGYAKITIPPLSELPRALREEVELQRQTRAGQLVLRLYAEERAKTIH